MVDKAINQPNYEMIGEEPAAQFTFFVNTE